MASGVNVELRPTGVSGQRPEETLVSPSGKTVVLSNDFKSGCFNWSILESIICNATLIHLSALASTIGVVQLSFRSYYWADVASVKNGFHRDGYRPREDVLNSLQFAAKLHEILIVASISAMAMHFARRCLIGSGIDFGVLMGAYQVGSAQWLVSRSFLDPVKGSMGSPWRTRFFAFLLGLVTLFANLVGPSSAIALLPTLDWWPMPSPFDGSAIVMYSTRNFSDQYPQELLSSSSSCTQPDNITSDLCPGAGFQRLLEWSTSFSNGSPGEENITMNQYSSDSLRTVSTMLAGDYNSPGRVIATTITTSAVSLIGILTSSVKYSSSAWSSLRKMTRIKLETSDVAPIYAPVVQVQCYAEDYLDATRRLEGPSFHAGYLNNNTAQDNFQVPEELWNASHPMNALNFSWVDIPSAKDTLGAVILVPYVQQSVNSELNASQQALIVSCATQARWGPVQLRTEPFADGMIASNISTQDIKIDSQLKGDGGLLDCQKFRSQYNLSIPITMSASWASMLNVRGQSATRKTNEKVDEVTAMEALLYPWITRTPASSSQAEDTFHFKPDLIWGDDDPLVVYLRSVMNTISLIVGMAVADGLARAVLPPQKSDSSETSPTWNTRNGIQPFYEILSVSQSNQVPMPYIINETVPDIPDFQKIRGSMMVFQGWRYGWAYSTQIKTVWFGLVILLIYALSVVVYGIYYICFLTTAKGWTSTAWGSIGDMVALALISEAPKKPKVSSFDFRKYAKWSTKVFVREQDEIRAAREGSDDEMLELVMADAGSAIGRENTGGRVMVGKKYD